MEILDAYPPNIEDIRKALKPGPHTVFTYAPNIYAPGDIKIPAELRAHEELHLKQQGKRPKAWWDEYLINPQFRLEQEIPAYRVQYQGFCKKESNRMTRYAYLQWLAKELSGPTYGNAITYAAAITKIRA